MKTILKYIYKNKFVIWISFCLIVMGGAPTALMLSSCASGPQRIAYQTAGTTYVAVDTAMRLWGAYVAQQKAIGTPVPIAQEQTVKAAYGKYQLAMAALCDAGAIYAAGGGTNGSLSGAFEIAAQNASQTIADLEKLIASFGVKL